MLHRCIYCRCILWCIMYCQTISVSNHYTILVGAWMQDNYAEGLIWFIDLSLIEIIFYLISFCLLLTMIQSYPIINVLMITVGSVDMIITTVISVINLMLLSKVMVTAISLFGRLSLVIGTCMSRWTPCSMWKPISTSGNLTLTSDISVPN